MRSADLTMVVTDRVGPADIPATRVVHGLLRDGRFDPEPPGTDAPAAARSAGQQDHRVPIPAGVEALAEYQRHAFSFASLGKFTDRPHLALARGLQAAETWPSGFFDILDTT